MFEVRAHIGKNRLVLVMKGDLSRDELTQMGEQVLEELGRLRPGVDLLMDVREALSIPDFDQPLSARVADRLRGMQLRRIVRVVGTRAQIAVQFERTSRAFGLSANLAYSMEEAERLLDGYTA